MDLGSVQWGQLKHNHCQIYFTESNYLSSGPSSLTQASKDTCRYSRCSATDNYLAEISSRLKKSYIYPTNPKVLIAKPQVVIAKPLLVVMAVVLPLLKYTSVISLQSSYRTIILIRHS